MADNVLTDKDREVLNQLRTGQFAGKIDMNQRARFEQAYFEKNGKKTNTCWTCSGSVKQLAKAIW